MSVFRQRDDSTPLPGLLGHDEGSPILDSDRFLVKLDPKISPSGKLNETLIGISCVKGSGKLANADFLLVNENIRAVGRHLRLWGVLDGVGTSFEAHMASYMAANKFNEFFETAGDESWGRGEFVSFAFRLAGEHVRHHLADGLTTATVALFDPSRRELSVGHLGDSRAYLVDLDGGDVRQLTEDHIDLELGRDRDTKEIIVTMPLSKVLGDFLPASRVLHEVKVPERNVFLCMVTDGVYTPLSFPRGSTSHQARVRMVADYEAGKSREEIIRGSWDNPELFKETLLKSLRRSSPNLQAAAKDLVEQAGATGWGDDRTVILARL